MARDPADIGGAPVDIGVGLEIEDVFVGERHLGEITPGGVHNAFRFGSRARRVQQVQQLFAVERHRRALAAGIGHQVVPPVVSTLGHGHIGIAPVDNDHILDSGRTCIESGIDIHLESRGGTPAITRVGGDDQPCLCIVAAIDNRVGREPAKDHRVGNTDTGARQHGDSELWDHGHIDRYAIASGQTQTFQYVGELGDLVEQTAIGDRSGIARFALPMIGDLVALASLDVTVEAVVADVELAANEPFRIGKLPVEHLVKVLVPADQLPCLAGPEALEISFGLVVQRPVVYQRCTGELGRRWKLAILGLVHLDSCITHWFFDSPVMNGPYSMDRCPTVDEHPCRHEGRARTRPRDGTWPSLLDDLVCSSRRCNITSLASHGSASAGRCLWGLHLRLTRWWRCCTP